MKADIGNYEITDATKIGTVAGKSFYAHPIFGDESDLLIEIDGALYHSGEWDLPTSCVVPYIILEITQS